MSVYSVEPQILRCDGHRNEMESSPNEYNDLQSDYGFPFTQLENRLVWTRYSGFYF